VKALVLGRFIRLVVTLLIVTFLASIMYELLPGDPALALVGTDTFNVSPELLDQARQQFHLDEPVPIRYVRWLGDALTGDLGRSFRTRQPVSDAIGERIGLTIELMVLSQLMALTFALVVAPLSALRPGKLYDRGMTALTFALLAIPAFIGGLVLLYVFAVKFQLLPATGYTPLGDGLVDNLKSLVLPAAALAAPEAAVYARVLRAEMVNTLQEDYILMARANGIPTWRVIFGHALRPSSFPLITLMGISIGALIGGAVIVETMFGLPGIGRLAVDSVTNRDFVTVQGVVALVTVGYVVVNFLVDLAYFALDPRVRRAGA
jgi:peptide/nickel transport system permease protein